VRNLKNYSAALGLLTLGLFSCKKDSVQEQGITVPTGARSLATTTTTTTSGTPLKNMFGVNAYEWDFLQNPSDPSNVAQVYQPKMNAIANFSQVRHYLDWSKIQPSSGGFTFNPSHAGSWNYDAMYQAAKANNVFMLVDLKCCPDWFLNSFYPADQQDAENVPAPSSADRSNPASYVLQAKAAFQFAARYGSNATVDKSLINLDATSRWTDDPINEVKVGMNLIKYIECDNERDKWWKGPQAQQTAQEYAANMSAFYDGDKGKLGKGVGVKTADPNMLVVMGGLSVPNVQYVKDMIEWCRQHRGYRADGSVDLCFDVINYHLYSNNADPLNIQSEATTGVAPELSKDGAIADQFVALSKSLPGHPEVWITEAGYDLNQGSPQRAIKIGNKSPEMTQADWTLRSSLMYISKGISRLFFYQLYDDSPGSSTQYATAGLYNSNLTPRAASQYIKQATDLMGDYKYVSTVSTSPMVLKFASGSKTMFVVWMPTQNNGYTDYKLNLGTTTPKSATLYQPQVGNPRMTSWSRPVSGGKVVVPASETPTFIMAN
jgi:hypothetical protein